MNRDPSHRVVSLLFCGDVMPGRGIDQILPFSVNPKIFEPYVKHAGDYVKLAERRNGPIPRKVDFDYVWGDALDTFEKHRPAVKVVNLETSVTKGGEPWPGKGIQYRMHPGNVPLLTCAGVDICVLANNHVLDWGYEGLRETLDTLHRAGLKTVGAGRDAAGAEAPAVARVSDSGRLIVTACGHGSSGIPEQWAASRQSGVRLLPDLSPAMAEEIGAKVQSIKRPGDIAVVSIHWGGNWEYVIPSAQRRFAHLLLDGGGVDLVHGHSSHHAKGIEVYKGKLILYGCGDLLTDYEGISGHEGYRGDLGLLYFVRLDTFTGNLIDVRMVPMTMHRLQLRRASRQDALWLKDRLSREGRKLGTWVEMRKGGELSLCWGKSEAGV